ncbi:hypothetical protein LBFF_0806 [Limosilactobacillus fermentum F-6]|uniref:zinc-ribbon domain-containing protein n=1 Tax=Limosilactobacillus fermentum TaxID=1613 RepID=UPI00032AA87A|nr:zinc ribbon domain-containing protein [Limosilactobacillus fermentum]AGL88703.1 hypothetical protein LBFF_0806 [Limosilactobacillus fermentum F-6]
MKNTEESTETMFCPNCGQKVPVGTKFCTNCGASLTAGRFAQKPNSTIDHIDSGPESSPQQSDGRSQINDGNPQNAKTPLDHFALLGIIFGGISWLLNFWGIVGILAVVFSILALNRHLEGINKTIAIIGLVSGVVNILYAFSIIGSY